MVYWKPLEFPEADIQEARLPEDRVVSRRAAGRKTQPALV